MGNENHLIQNQGEWHSFSYYSPMRSNGKIWEKKMVEKEWFQRYFTVSERVESLCHDLVIRSKCYGVSSTLIKTQTSCSFSLWSYTAKFKSLKKIENKVWTEWQRDSDTDLSYLKVFTRRKLKPHWRSIVKVEIWTSSNRDHAPYAL